MELKDLDDNDVSNILTGLGNLPIIKGHTTWMKVTQQLHAQQNAPTPPADFPKAVADTAD